MAEKTLYPPEATRLVLARHLLQEGFGLSEQVIECDQRGVKFGEQRGVRFHQPERFRLNH
jgi:hypothetical protein